MSKINEIRSNLSGLYSCKSNDYDTQNIFKNKIDTLLSELEAERVDICTDISCPHRSNRPKPVCKTCGDTKKIKATLGDKLAETYNKPIGVAPSDTKPCPTCSKPAPADEIAEFVKEKKAFLKDFIRPLGKLGDSLEVSLIIIESLQAQVKEQAKEIEEVPCPDYPNPAPKPDEIAEFVKECHRVFDDTNNNEIMALKAYTYIESLQAQVKEQAKEIDVMLSMLQEALPSIECTNSSQSNLITAIGILLQSKGR